MSAAEEFFDNKGDLDSLFEQVRLEFPYTQQNSVAYFDSAASTLKPKAVIEAVSNYYSYSHANIHRGVYKLSQEATQLYDNARSVVASFLSADAKEIVFTKGTTEGFNLLANSYLKPVLKAGDDVIISVAEHHANIVPWQLPCKEKGATIKALPLTQDQRIDVDKLESMISKRTKLISLTHVSNALGSLLDVKKVVSVAKKYNIPVALDGAQAVSHFPVNVKELDCDFYLFSGHKLYGPTGIGVLYAKAEHLSNMLPYQTGGDMIETVDIQESTFQEAPQKFEAGTPPIAAAVGLAEAVRFTSSIGFENIHLHERQLQERTMEILDSIPGITTLGPRGHRIGAISFIADWGHPHDIGTILDSQDVAVRTGHHCAQPLMKELGVSATTRISFGVYNNLNELETFSNALKKAHSILS